MERSEINRIKEKYPGIFRRVAKRYKCHPSYVTQVLVQQISPGKRMWETFYEVIEEMKGEKVKRATEDAKLKSKILKTALA